MTVSRPNDTGDADNGSNDLQTSPCWPRSAATANISTVTGTFNSTPNTYFTLQFFLNVAADPSGYGEGQTLLGTRHLTTDSNGNATFSFNFYTAVPAGQSVGAQPPARPATPPSSRTAITWSTTQSPPTRHPLSASAGPTRSTREIRSPSMAPTRTTRMAIRSRTRGTLTATASSATDRRHSHAHLAQ